MNKYEAIRFKDDSGGKELVIEKTSFPHLSEVTEIALIKTAVSQVILISTTEGGYVFKLRRRVKIGELCDFTTLEKRKEDCQRELEKNQPLASDIYLDVVPVVSHNGNLIFAGEGEVVDWAVVMRRFKEEDKMDNLLKSGQVRERYILALADKIAGFHRSLPIPVEVNYGSLENVKRIWAENFSQARDLLGTSAITIGTINDAERIINQFLDSNRSLFENRMGKGKVLDCHGDLHTGNVVIENGDPKPFDALEFNKAYSIHDVASEIAFMAMDLEFQGFPEFSQLFVSRYIESTGDREMAETGLLGFYKAHRAWARGKIEAWQGNIEKAKQYFKFAELCSQALVSHLR